jgi:alpha/beta hydrolase family protein
MKKPNLVRTIIFAARAGLFAVTVAFTSDARATGRIVDAVQVSAPEEMIPGVTFGEVPYAEYRCRFQGSLTLPYDSTGQVYTYDMPMWIIAPAKLENGNGTVVLEALHTQAVIATRPSGSEGELPLVLRQLGPRFLFRQGMLGGSPAPNYTWVGVRWDPRALTTPFPQVRYDHVYEQRHGVPPGAIGAPASRATEVGKAMVADLADAVRQGVLIMRGEDEERQFASVQHLIAYGHSLTGLLLRQLLNDPPSAANGGGAHHEPLFDGWLIVGAKGAYDQWPTISAAGVLTPRAPIIYTEPTAASHGQVIEIATEADMGHLRDARPGNEFVRFGDTAWYRSYEIAGAQHFAWGNIAANGLPGAAILLPDLADSLSELAAIASVPPDYVLPVIDAFDCVETHPLIYANPLDWDPVGRALLVAMDQWLTDGTPPPPSLWLTPTEGEARYGDASIKRDSVGNALGGIRLPDVEVGRGQFYGVSPDSPPAGGNIAAGAYFDLHDRFRNHGEYVRAFAIQANALLAARLLLEDDHEALTTSAAESRVGIR